MKVIVDVETFYAERVFAVDAFNERKPVTRRCRTRPRDYPSSVHYQLQIALPKNVAAGSRLSTTFQSTRLLSSNQKRCQICCECEIIDGSIEHIQPCH